MIKTIYGGQEREYKKDRTKTKFRSVDDLLIKKPLKFHAMAIIIRSVFEGNEIFYPQIYLDAWTCYSMKELVFQKELILIKQINQKNFKFNIIDTF